LRKNRKESIEINNSLLNGNDTPLLKNSKKLAVTRSSINQTKI